MDLWTALLDVLILLLAAMLLGGLCERFKQSAILGYLLAGTLVGPNALDLMPNHEAVATIAELATLADYQKVAGSRAIAVHLKLDGSNRSQSFNVLVDGLRRFISNF